MKVFITGQPGCGKSTLVMQIADALKASGWKVGGILTPEVREHGHRLGFKVVDIVSKREAWLASIHIPTKNMVGKYYVHVDDFESIAIPALEYALNECNLIIIDEIGKMEMFSQNFRELLEKILKSDKNLLAVVHRAYAQKLKQYGKLFWLTRENFEKVKREALLDFMKK